MMAAAHLNEPIVIERTYRAPVEDLWALWTTPSGFESWWGPEGYAVVVHRLEPRVGGILEYDMIAETPEAIAACINKSGVLTSHSQFAEFRPHERLTLLTLLESSAGTVPFEHLIEVDFRAAGPTSTMVVTIHPHRTAEHMAIAVKSFGAQLARLDQRFAH